MTAHYTTENRVSIITLDAPPLNTLGHATRAGIHAGLRRALQDAETEAVILIGAGRAFCAGADINEFEDGGDASMAEPSVASIIGLIETAGKPVIAALHGVAMGGGLELAMACHYRIALADTQLAQPEIKLGILAGGGGTQRLPRLLGLERAAQMLLDGDSCRAAECVGTDLIDAVIEPETPEGLRAAALTFARQVVAEHRRLRRARDVNLSLPDADFFVRLRRAHAARAASNPAVEATIQALEASVNLPFDEGFAFAERRSMELMQTPESQAMRAAFFAERKRRRAERGR